MVPWPSGSLVQWLLSPVVPWSSGSLVRSFLGSVVPWFSGSSVIWLFDVPLFRSVVAYFVFLSLSGSLDH